MTLEQAAYAYYESVSECTCDDTSFGTCYWHLETNKQVEQAFTAGAKFEQDRAAKFHEEMIIKLTLLVGACRMPTTKKKDIEQSIESCIKKMKEYEAGR